MQVKLIRDNPVSDERTVHPGDWPRRFEPIRKSMLREFFGTIESERSNGNDRSFLSLRVMG